MSKRLLSSRRSLIVALLVLVAIQWAVNRRAEDFQAEPELVEPEQVAEMVEPEEVPRTKVRIRPVIQDDPVAESPAQSEAEEQEPATNQQEKQTNPADVIPASETVIAEGEAIMQGMEEGEVPVIFADYRTHLGFDRYRQEMERRGSRFYVMRRGVGRLEWLVDFESGRLGSDVSYAGLTCRSRAIRNEVRVLPILEKARNLMPGSYDVVLLIPSRLEAGLVGALQRGVSRLNRRVEDFREFQGVYVQKEGRLALRFLRGTTRTGEEVGLDLLVPI